MSYHSEIWSSETKRREDRTTKLQMGNCASSAVRGSNVRQTNYDFQEGEHATYKNQLITIVRQMSVPISGRPRLRIRFSDGKEETVCQDDLKHIPS